MHRPAALLSLSLLVGCGPPLCDADGLALVAADVSVNCEVFRSNVAIARHILSQRLIEAQTYWAIFEGVGVRVRADAAYPTLWRGDVTGTYYPVTREIELGADGHSLLHEMLHHLDFARGVSAWDTDAHLGWRENGYEAAIALYLRSAAPLAAPRVAP